MAAVHTSLVKRRHAYTSADIPWSIDVDASGSADSPDGLQAGRRLFRYLSGGGLRAFGQPSGRMVLIRRQARFLWLASALAALWILFLFV